MACFIHLHWWHTNIFKIWKKTILYKHEILTNKDNSTFFTRQHYVEYYDLQSELVDHLADAIEAQIEPQNLLLTKL
jgi:hypothetical protein